MYNLWCNPQPPDVHTYCPDLPVPLVSTPCPFPQGACYVTVIWNIDARDLLTPPPPRARRRRRRRHPATRRRADMPTMSLFNETNKTAQQVYPELMKRIIVINPPMVFSVLYGNFDITLGHFSRSPQLYATAHAPWDALCLVLVLTGCWLAGACTPMLCPKLGLQALFAICKPFLYKRVIDKIVIAPRGVRPLSTSLSHR